jgi:brefeldin A-resistance guanine nucleotide exchange factor 1
LQTKSQKKLILTGAARFNSKPKTGLTFLEENGLIYADLSPDVSKARSLATFLKGCTRLDKRLLGDYISKPDNIEILKAFIGLFDFKDVRKFFLLNLHSILIQTPRNRLQMLCESSSKHFDFPVNPSKFPASQRCLPLSTSLLAQVKLVWFPDLLPDPTHFSEGIKTEDAVYVLAYSVIMLNTDLHNPQIRVSRSSSIVSYF